MSERLFEDLLAEEHLSNLDKLLICLLSDCKGYLRVGDIKRFAMDRGLVAARKWNISNMLRNCGGMAVRTSAGWRITNKGIDYIRCKMPSRSITSDVNVDKLTHLSNRAINDGTRSILGEALVCYQHGCYRATVMLSWNVAISVLYNVVVARKLNEFNIEARRRDAKWKDASTIDDLGGMKEKLFLEVLVSLSIIGKNVKQELEHCLTLRNSCCHVNSLKISESRVSSHLEVLMLNVFMTFT